MDNETVFFTPKSLVIVTTDDDTNEMGELVARDEYGLMLKTTHEIKMVTHSATPEQVAEVEKVFAGMTPMELKLFALENGLSLLWVMIWNTEKLRRSCVSYALHELKEEALTLLPLSMPVHQWIAYPKKVVLAAEYIQEKTLSNLDFDPSGEYSETKTEDTGAAEK